MARIPLLRAEDSDLPEETRELLARRASGRGRLINLYRALANHPAAMQAFGALGGIVYGGNSSLSRKEAELAYTTATVVNHCYY